MASMEDPTTPGAEPSPGRGRGDPLTGRVGYLVKRLQLALRHAMDDALQASGLSAPQYAALGHLVADPGLSNAELARRSFVTPQTMHQILAGLERADLVRREADPDHGRILRALPTDEGLARLERADAAVRGVESRMLEPLDAAARSSLAGALEACARALEDG